MRIEGEISWEPPVQQFRVRWTLRKHNGDPPIEWLDYRGQSMSSSEYADWLKEGAISVIDRALSAKRKETET